MQQIDKLIRWINRGTPIVAVTTVDGELFTKTAVTQLTDTTRYQTQHLFLEWKMTTGILPFHNAAMEAAAMINNNDAGEPPKAITGDVSAALERALEFMPTSGVLFMQNINFLLDSKDEQRRLEIIQLILDCRTAFKASQRALVLVCNDIILPPELANNVRDINIPYPTKDELEVMIRKLTTDAEFLVIEDNIKKAAAGLLGMSIFTAENVAAACISKEGYNLDEIHAERIADINRTPGLRAEIVKPMNRDTVVGLDGVCDFIDACYAGDDPFTLPVLVDEAEKSLAGSNSDSTGVTQDILAQLLTNMEEKQWRGSAFYGVGGSGKTETAKYTASRIGLLIWLDLGATKNKYVGQSEANIRMAFAKLHAIGGSGVFFMFTMNGMANIPAPLLRRLMNLWIYGFPKPAAQVKMWAYYLNKFNVPVQDMPPHPNWTGAEIKKCASYAGGMLKKPDGTLWTLAEAARYITPIFNMMGDEVEQIFRQSAGKYLDPSTGGTFEYTPKANKTTVGDLRKFSKGSN